MIKSVKSLRTFWPLWALTFVSILPTEVHSATDCNEAICGSIVSKCTLLKSCECEMDSTGCSCCKKCFACLDYLHAECCSCVGLCPSNSNMTEEQLIKKPESTVGEIRVPTPMLWNALMEGEDLNDRWEKLTYQVDLRSVIQQNNANSVIQDNLVIQNCTVAFLNNEMGKSKCEKSCDSMGATSYRWFSINGCCECVGHGCINYGVNEARCGFTNEDNEANNSEDEETKAQKVEINYEDLSEDELRMLEAEYGLLDDEDEIIKERPPED